LAETDTRRRVAGGGSVRADQRASHDGRLAGCR